MLRYLTCTLLVLVLIQPRPFAPGKTRMRNSFSAEPAFLLQFRSSNPRGEAAAGKDLSSPRALQIALGDHTWKHISCYPAITWEKSSIPRPGKLCQRLQVSHSCLKYAMFLKIPARFAGGGLGLAALSQEMSDGHISVPRRSSGPSPVPDSLCRLKKQSLWEFLVGFFPLETAFLREFYRLSGRDQHHGVGYLCSWLIALLLCHFSSGLVIHEPIN